MTDVTPTYHIFVDLDGDISVVDSRFHLFDSIIIDGTGMWRVGCSLFGCSLSLITGLNLDLCDPRYLVTTYDVLNSKESLAMDMPTVTMMDEVVIDMGFANGSTSEINKETFDLFMSLREVALL